MKDMQAHARKIRSDATECMMLSNLVTEERGHLFARIAEHLNSLALEIETETVTNDEPAAPSHQQVDFAAHHAAATDHLQAARSWHQHPWVLFVGLLVIAGAIVWAMNRTELQSISQADPPPKTSPANLDSNQELAVLLSDEKEQRKVIGEQLNALIGRLDTLARDLDDLKSLRAGTSAASSKDATGQDRSAGSGATVPAAEQTPRAEANGPSSETSVAATAEIATVSPIQAE